MKVHYDKESDILMLEVAKKKIDDSYETDYGVINVSEKGEPVLIEIFSASKVLKNITKTLPKDVRKQIAAI